MKTDFEKVKFRVFIGTLAIIALGLNTQINFRPRPKNDELPPYLLRPVDPNHMTIEQQLKKAEPEIRERQRHLEELKRRAAETKAKAEREAASRPPVQKHVDLEIVREQEPDKPSEPSQSDSAVPIERPEPSQTQETAVLVAGNDALAGVWIGVLQSKRPLRYQSVRIEISPDLRSGKFTNDGKGGPISFKLDGDTLVFDDPQSPGKTTRIRMKVGTERDKADVRLQADSDSIPLEGVLDRL